MMKIEALQGLRGDYGRLHRGEIAEVSDALGQSLVKRGLAKLVGQGGGEEAEDGAEDEADTNEPGSAEGHQAEAQSAATAGRRAGARS